MQVPIRKLFWDAVELAMEAQVHRLAKDIASALGTSETPLLQALKQERVKVALFEDGADDDVEDFAAHHCSYLIQTPGGAPFLMCCGGPVCWRAGTPTRHCLEHLLLPSNTAQARGKPIVQRLVVDEFEGYVCVESGYVYSEDGTLCGRYQERTQRLLLFEPE